MRTKYLLLALGAAAFASTPASAASLVSAAVTGLNGTVPTGTVWNTDSADTFYALFLVRPFANVINPTDNFTSTPSTSGANNFGIAGDGFPTGTSANSDSSYLLTLIFGDGATISGQYDGSTFVGGTSSTVGALTYTLTGFGWDRSPADNVSQFNAVSGGDPADYSGQFAFTTQTPAVPEPATWGMMLLGFGAIGFAMRRRKQAEGTKRIRLSYS